MNMDPDCAICSAPATLQCDCETKGLDIAVRQAEQRMMSAVFTDIRLWVRGHARDYILEYFDMLRQRRNEVHASNIQRISEHAWHYYHTQPNPADIANADLELKRGIDEDWKASVQRYPDVLEYYYSLVDIGIPADDDPQVSEPPISALAGGKPRVRLRHEPSSSSRRRRRSRVSIEPIPDAERRRGEGRRQGVSFAVPTPSHVAAPTTGYSYVQPEAFRY